MSALRFTSLDTWFFRESRPLEAIGGSELASLFPPPPRTLIGAVRTAIGDALGADWRAFGSQPDDYRLSDGRCLRDLIGYGDDCGPLALAGPWLVYENERLYPMPLCLLERTEGNTKARVRLRIGSAARTPLDRIRLPALPPDNAGAKTLDRVWVTQAGLARILAGGVPSDAELRRAADLFTEEPRLGIARDNVKRVAGEGMLYQTRHLRSKAGLAIEADIALPEGMEVTGRLVRLGGEGRLAHLQVCQGSTPAPAPGPDARTRSLILILLTPARLGDGAEGWLPPGFEAGEENEVRVWKGRIADITLTLHAAVLGKVRREGGWDLAAHMPREVVSLIPAGSCYYVTAEGDLSAALTKLHGARIGEDQFLGRGQIACGLWNANEF
jgi:CRISPR-associated protein Cmr3